MSDIIYRTDEFVFSYRVAGILIHNGKILLQKPQNDDGYALPGGHISYGETSDESLIREFREEIGVDIKVDRLVLVGEVFFPWDNKPCQQISLYYQVSLCDKKQITLDGTFRANVETGNERIDFYWIPLSQLDNIKFYPSNIKEDILSIPQNIKHFVYKE